MRWRGTQWLIEEYLRYCGGERHISRIEAYMYVMHQVSIAATRTALWRLRHAGRIVETEPRYYRVSV